MNRPVPERFRELRCSSSHALRNQLVEEHIGFAEYLARRFVNRGEPFEDLRQVAMIGLVKSVERFDPDRGVNFTSFAAPTITGEIKRHFRDRTWSIRVPRRLQELTSDVQRCRGELAHELGRSPTVPEIAARIDTSEEAVLEGIAAAGAYRSSSLDDSTPGDDDRPLGDRVPAHCDDLGAADDRAIVRELLGRLPTRERRIVYLRYFVGLTQSEIADDIGISQMHVSRILARSIEALGEAATHDQRDVDGRASTRPDTATTLVAT